MQLKPIVFIILLLSPFITFSAQKYKIIDLDFPEEITYSTATSINDKGQICGTYSSKGKGTLGIFFWDPNTGFQDIGEEPAGAPIINNNGVIASAYRIRDKDVRQRIRRESIFLWDKKNGFSDIGLKDSKQSFLFDLNNLNQVIFLRTNDKDECSLYSCSSLLDCFNNTWVAKNNDSSKILGFSQEKNNTVLRVFDQLTNDYEDVVMFKGHNCSVINGFNNKGVAIGNIRTSYGNPYGFTWSEENGLELFDTFFPICINDRGVIVGNSCPGLEDSLGFTIQNNGEEININETLALEFDTSTPWSLIYQICDINNQDCLVGSGVKGEEMKALILTPID